MKMEGPQEASAVTAVTVAPRKEGTYNSDKGLAWGDPKRRDDQGKGSNDGDDNATGSSEAYRAILPVNK